MNVGHEGWVPRLCQSSPAGVGGVSASLAGGGGVMAGRVVARVAAAVVVVAVAVVVALLLARLAVHFAVEGLGVGGVGGLGVGPGSTTTTITAVGVGMSHLARRVVVPGVSGPVTPVAARGRVDGGSGGGVAI